MRILHVSGWLAPRYGGSTSVILGDVAALGSLGHDAEIITTNIDGRATLDVETGRLMLWGGVEVTFHQLSIPRRFLTSWPMVMDLRRRVAGFDVVHIHSLYRFHTVAAAYIARRSRVPYVVQPHGSLDPWHRSRRRLAKDLYHAFADDPVIRGAAAVVCTSSSEERAIRDLGYAVPTWVIPVGIDADELRAPAPLDQTPKQSAGGSESKVIAFLGRISEKKGLDVLVDAFLMIAASDPTARLVVGGPDDEMIGHSLAPKVASAGLGSRVDFIGLVGGATKRSLLQNASVLVLPSADESFGIVVAEAMAVGCPVIVSPHVAIADLVRRTGAGMVAERDPEDVARAISVILSKPGVAARMGEAGRRAVDGHFVWPRVAGELERLYMAVTMTGQPSSDPPDVGHLGFAITGISEMFVCPVCRADLRPGEATFECAACDLVYAVVDGIPILVSDLEATAHDEIDHLHAPEDRRARGVQHKADQAAHFDRELSEDFEIERPNRTPRLYRFLIDEKFRRAVLPFRPHLPDATALVVCGGSGMDAEYLARAGARVIASDISLGAAMRTRERARRHGVQIISLVADVEHLPFADESVDLVFVHDGLHHLERPMDGLAEMARVARRWVSVTEPARAAVTALAVHAGLAKEREEAGNAVARLTTAEVATELARRQFRPILSQRYAMYYRHEPGAVFRALSSRGVFNLVQVAWQIANAVIGRFGNKMVVVAERQAPD
jgi:glycosyltransferase involved in cell wall biosynthesis/ubiquinone/menaquinone biosynthesis C-methylase UbiE/uncharacterized protein YbaR (Trm112 family)